MGKDKIKRALWMRGFKVKDVAGVAGYDLLVEGKWKVKVTERGETKEDLIIRTDGCDVVAIYRKGITPDKLYAIKSKNKDGEEVFETWVTNPKSIFKVEN